MDNSQLERLVGEINRSLNKIDVRLKDLSNKVDALEERISDAEYKADEIEESVSANDIDLNALREEFETIKGEVSDIILLGET